MFEDLILTFYLLIMIVQRFFANAIAYSMVGVSHADRKHSVYTTVLRVRELNLQTSYLFELNCHSHAVYATLLNIKVYLKLYFISLVFPSKWLHLMKRS